MKIVDEDAIPLQRNAKDNLLSNRSKAFARDSFRTQRDQLPKALHPLFDILEDMRGLLLGMYSSYERNFDGSYMPDIVPPFVVALQDLVKAAGGVEIEPLHIPSTADQSDMVVHMLNDKIPEEGRTGDQSNKK